MIKIITALIFFTLSSVSLAQMENLNNKERVKYIFQNLTKDRLELIDQFYSKDILFIDPVGKIEGSKKITAYYKNLYQNVKKIRFDFSEVYESNETVIAVWSMYLETEKLNGGEGFTVEGTSVIKFNSEGKAVFHRDYFDMGAFIYERIPLLGALIKKIRLNLKDHE